MPKVITSFYLNEDIVCLMSPAPFYLKEIFVHYLDVMRVLRVYLSANGFPVIPKVLIRVLRLAGTLLLSGFDRLSPC